MGYLVIYHMTVCEVMNSHEIHKQVRLLWFQIVSVVKVKRPTHNGCLLPGGVSQTQNAQRSILLNVFKRSDSLKWVHYSCTRSESSIAEWSRSGTNTTRVGQIFGENPSNGLSTIFFCESRVFLICVQQQEIKIVPTCKSKEEKKNWKEVYINIPHMLDTAIQD